MIRLDLFRALNPTADYPSSPLNLSLNGVKYDLLLPPAIADVLSRNASLDNGLVRLDKFCDQLGFDQLRRTPQAFHSLAAGKPAYADAETALELRDTRVPSGYLARFVAVSLPPVLSIIDVIQHLKIVEPGVAIYIRENPRSFRECGGFEVARVVYYFNEVERESLRTKSEESSRAAEAERRGRNQFIELANGLNG